MAAVSSGHKSLLEITACTIDDAGNINANESDSFTVMINPASYSYNRSVSFNKKTGIGQIGNSLKYNRVKEDSVSFDIVIDGTGAVNSAAPGKNSEDVKTQIQKLDKVLGYDGNIHEPKHSRLLWGSLIFFGRMESMSSQYTLFKPSGEPLRAKIKLAFVGFMSDKKESLLANRSSPDLSHLIEVKAGDTLPQLCNVVYRDSAYYIDIARLNNLDNFRQLTPGDKLYFPPLK